jgi:uncharacterized membrane protein YdjX (TVP38/TMEM64 family)
VERWLADRPRLAALDRVIDRGGWRVVALLRLSPLVPFNVQNYFYGLTSIRFVPCVLASWVAMMPGTWLYVGLGVAGRAGLDALAGRGTGLGPGGVALLVAGLAATAALTFYLARLTRAALAEAERPPDAPGGRDAPGAG